MRVIGGPGVAPVAGAWVDGTTAIFRVADPGYRLSGVRLSQDVRIPGDRLDFHRDGDGWRLAIGLPPVHRMEYLLDFRYPDGRTATVTDPGNPGQAPGAFGPKSVLEFPAYRTPGWLTAPADAGRGQTFDVPVRSLGDAVAVRTWAPADAPDDEPLPLLVAHDGPEYDVLASLTRYLAAGVAGRWLPRLRAALLSPGPRDRWYSANARYARALAGAPRSRARAASKCACTPAAHRSRSSNSSLLKTTRRISSADADKSPVADRSVPLRRRSLRRCGPTLPAPLPDHA